ncbi:MAG: Ku protein [Verrucomicrobiota bacterium]|jgi:DNA end-binding protein Ku
MRAIWKGTISFGLVSIPISLFAATRREELKFRLLRGADLSPVNFKRVAEADGKEVPWDKIVKGYEYEKGKFVVIRDEDFARVDVEATQTVDIMNFVKLEEINPLLFSKPYYLQAEKGGDKAYVLLRDALANSGKVGIAKVVIKERQHLAAIKAQPNGLMLELMRFPDEVIDSVDFKAPQARSASKAEMDMASKLIESMSAKWEPDDYHDDYKEGLEKLIEQKVASGGHELPAPRKPHKATTAVDLVSVLQQSIRKTQENGKGQRDPKVRQPKSRVHLN